MQPEQTAPVQAPQKVSLNPFRHMGKGASNLFKTNLSSLVVTAIIHSVIGFVAAAALMIGMFGLMFSSAMGEVSSTAFTFVLIGVLIAVLLLAVPTLAVNRVILTGSRKVKIGAGEAFKHAFKRFWLAILTGLFLVFAIIIISAVFGVFTVLLGPIGALLAILSIPLFIFAALRLAYVQLVLVEDDKPTGPIAAIKASNNTAKVSMLALFFYFVFILLLSIILQIITGGDANTPDPFTSFAKPSVGELIAPIVVSTIVSFIVNYMILAGFANLYNESRQKLGLATAGTVAAPINSPAPAAPASAAAPTTQATEQSAVEPQAQPSTPPSPPTNSPAPQVTEPDTPAQTQPEAAQSPQPQPESQDQPQAQKENQEKSN